MMSGMGLLFLLGAGIMIFIFVQTLQKEGMQVKSDPNSEEHVAQAMQEAQEDSFAKIMERAQQAFDEERYYDAEAALETALRMEPSNEQVLGMLAFVLEAQGEYPASQAIYEKALKLHPNSSKLHGAYANLLVAMKEDEKAKAHFIEAVQLEGTTAVVYYNFAKLLEKLGEKEAAIQGYEEALKLDKDMQEAKEALDRLLNIKALEG